MALLYYPKSSILARVDASNPLYEELILATSPNMVFYFDTSSVINAASGSMLFITSSWALTASVTILFASNSFSASYANTASFAQNAGGSGPVSDYTTVFTSSTNWITCSFLNGSQVINLATGSVIYSFTSSNMPGVGKSSDISIFINNTATTTSSLSFPSNWINVGGGWPTSITASKDAVLALRAIDTSTVVGSMNIQL